jgi:hypothetical protein
VIITELLISYKYREGTGHITETPTPWYIFWPWTIAILVLIFGFLYLRFKPDHTLKYPGKNDPVKINPIELSSPTSPRRSPRRHLKSK